MFETFRRWRESRGALAELDRMQAREGATFGFLVDEKLDESRKALERGDRLRATQLWDEALAAAPAVAKRSRDAVHILLGLGRVDEAEAIMLDGQKRFPSEASFFEGYAEVAHRRGDRDEALRRWRAMRTKFPRLPQGYRSEASALCDLGRFEEADELLSKGVAVAPRDIMIRFVHAQVAGRRKNWKAAYDRWDVVRRLGHHGGISGQAEALSAMGRFEEADALLAEARFSHPLQEDIAFEHCRVAEARGDLPDAIRRWTDAVRRFPLVGRAYRYAIEAMLRAGDHGQAEAMLALLRDNFPEQEHPSLAEIELGLGEKASKAI